MLYYDKLRYRLMPYIYSMAAKTYFEDYTIMRGLIMDFPNDKNVANINDQYLFGSSFLINPVSEYDKVSRKVYLPSGTGWYDFYTGKYFEGGRNINAVAPYSRMPVFVKEGSIIPVGPDLQFTTQKPADTISLFIYTGKNGSFTLFEDEGTNYNYEKGMYSAIAFDYNEKEKKLIIQKRRGTFPGMLQKRIFNIIWIQKSNPVPFDFGQKYNEQVSYVGEKLSLSMKTIVHGHRIEMRTAK